MAGADKTSDAPQRMIGHNVSDDETAEAEDDEATEPPRRKPARVYPGTGIFISPPKPTVASAEVVEDGGVSLNFVNARIQDVVKSILGSVLGQNYVIDETIRARITMQTTRPLPQGAVLSVLETALRQSGVALVKEGELYKFVPVAGLPRGTGELRVDRDGAFVKAGQAIMIAPLAFVAAAEMNKILEPIAPKGGILHVNKKRNLIMFSGDGHQLAAMQKVISAFDVDWMSGTSSGLFPLEFADAQTAHKELQSILVGERDKDLADALRLIPILRLNAILAISPIRRNIEHVRTWIKRLDVPGDSVEKRIFLYPVQNGSAADLAVVLNKFFRSEGEPEDADRGLIAPGEEPVRLSSPPRAGDSGRASTSAQRSASPGPAAPPPPAKAEGRSAATRGGGAVTAATDAPIQIVEDELRNALLISATTRDYRNINKLLRKLDVPPLQVLIEATIAEVRLRDDLRYGLQWFFRRGNNEFTLSEVGSGAVAATFPGFSYIFAGSNARVAFDTLTSMTDVNIVSSPQLMVMNNMSARLQVGDQVPIPVQSSVGVSSGDAPIVNTIQFRDTGVILQVKPRVNNSGMVTLEINQEVSDAAPTTSSGIDAPTIQQRQISSVVTIESGNTLALGGIIRTNRSINKSGLPILSELPIIGSLFGSTGTQDDRTELLILLTPRVVRDTKEIVAVTDELRRRFSRLEPLFGEHLPKKQTRKKKATGKAVSKNAARFGNAPKEIADNRTEAEPAAGTSEPSGRAPSEPSGRPALATTQTKTIPPARPAGQADKVRPLGVRVGKHRTFTRLVFDWPAVVPYSLTESDRSVTVTFARSARINLHRLRRRLKGGLAKPQASVGDGWLKFKIEKPAGQKVRHFLVGSKVVLDFKSVRNVKRVAASSRRRHRSQPLASLRASKSRLPLSRVISVNAAAPQPVTETYALSPAAGTPDMYSGTPSELDTRAEPGPVLALVSSEAQPEGSFPAVSLFAPDDLWDGMTVEEQIYGTE
jgi:general secretion pathway protein D